MWQRACLLHKYLINNVKTEKAVCKHSRHGIAVTDGRIFLLVCLRRELNICQNFAGKIVLVKNLTGRNQGTETQKTRHTAVHRVLASAHLSKEVCPSLKQPYRDG